MTNTPPPPGDDGSDRLGEREQLWWDRLAGKPVAADDAQALARADSVRRAVLAQYRADLEDAAQDAAADEQARQQVLFEARRRGWMDPPAASRPRRAWWAGLAAALLLGVLVVVQLQRGEDDDGPPMRGDIVVQKLTDAAPAQRAESIAALLRQAGAQVRLRSGKRATWLEIEVPPENFETLAPLLKQAGLSPQAGLVVVQITKP